TEHCDYVFCFSYLPPETIIVSDDKSTLIMRPVFGEYYILSITHQISSFYKLVLQLFLLAAIARYTLMKLLSPTGISKLRSLFLSEDKSV
ncbi:MAG: hypothetical protein ACYTBV_20635, partial [Planctomycetota bacterium]